MIDKETRIFEEKEYYFSPDNYLFALFKYEAKKNLTEISMGIWGDTSRGYAIVNNGAQHIFKIPVEINEDSSHSEMEQLLDYYISFDIDLILNEQNKEEEAQKIFEIIEEMKESEYSSSKKVLFWYQTGNKEKKRAKTINDMSRYNLSFENWSDILTVDEILEAMQIQWFDKY